MPHKNVDVAELPATILKGRKKQTPDLRVFIMYCIHIRVFVFTFISVVLKTVTT